MSIYHFDYWKFDQYCKEFDELYHSPCVFDDDLISQIAKSLNLANCKKRFRSIEEEWEVSKWEEAVCCESILQP